jgi:hypothetical protein
MNINIDVVAKRSFIDVSFLIVMDDIFKYMYRLKHSLRKVLDNIKTSDNAIFHNIITCSYQRS